MIIFYLFSLFFIANEIFYVFNKTRLDTYFVDKEISSIPKWDIYYYIFRILFWIWLFIGIFTTQYTLFITLICAILLKLPFFHINKKLYIIWDNLIPTISIIIMLITIYKGIF